MQWRQLSVCVLLLQLASCQLQPPEGAEQLRAALPDVSWRRVHTLQRLVRRHHGRDGLTSLLRAAGADIEPRVELPDWLQLSDQLPTADVPVNNATRLLNLLIAVTIGPYIAPMLASNISARCLNDSWALASNIVSDAGWPLQMFDADGKLPDGLAAGNLNALGSWYQCRSVTATATSVAQGLIPLPESTFRGKHCRAQYQLAEAAAAGGGGVAARWPAGVDAVGMAPLLPLLLPLTGQLLPVTASVGVCMPSSCSAAELQRSLQQRAGTNVTVTVHDADCSVSDQPAVFSAGDIVMIVVLCVAGLLMVVGTFIDVVREMSGRDGAQISVTLDGFRRRLPATLQRVLLAFSVWTNGRKLLDTSAAADTLRCLHGLRFLSMTWVILGHQYMFGFTSVPWANEFYAFSVLNSLAFAVIDNGTVSVDSFFFLSGLLVAYVFMRNMDKSRGRFNIVLYYVHRYIRLTPVLAMVIAFVATLYVHLGDGPFWGKNAVYGGSHYMCSRYWWKNLVYANNLYESDKSCLGQTWYLANDMQMFVLSPVVLLPLYFWPTLGQLWLMLLLAVNVFVRGYVTYHNELGPTGGDPSLRYFVPWCRYGVYLVGVYTGWWLHVRRGRRLRLSLSGVLAGWSVAALAACLVVYGIHDYTGVPAPATPGRSASVVYAALSRPVWGVCLAWLVVACVHGYGGFINQLLSWRGWVPLSRLTYCMYLVSIDAQIWFYASLKSVLYFDQTVAVYQFLATLIASLPVALLFSLAFEAPMIALEKIIFGNVGVNKPAKQAAPVPAAPETADATDCDQDDSKSPDIAAADSIHANGDPAH